MKELQEKWIEAMGNGSGLVSRRRNSRGSDETANKDRWGYSQKKLEGMKKFKSFVMETRRLESEVSYKQTE